MKGVLKLTAICLLGFGATSQAQVKFKLTQKEDQKTYVVSMVSDQSLKGAKGITGTGQVTVRVKSEKGFVLSNLESNNMDAQWDNGATLKSPEGARAFDYISFNLRDMGTKSINYTEGKEVELFTFQNNGSEENVKLELIDNDSDPLVNFSKNEFNVRNHISVLGFGQKNAYSGNLRDELLDDISKKLRVQNVFPNPAIIQTTVSWENALEEQTGDLYLSVVDGTTSLEVMKKKVDNQIGKFSIDLSLSSLKGGIYLVYIERDNVKIGTAKKLMVLK